MWFHNSREKTDITKKTCTGKILSSLSAVIFLFITAIYYWPCSSCDAGNSICPQTWRWPIPRTHLVTRSCPKKRRAIASSKQGCCPIEQVWLVFLSVCHWVLWFPQRGGAGGRVSTPAHILLSGQTEAKDQKKAQKAAMILLKMNLLNVKHHK